MKKRHYVLIGSLIGIPFISQLILVTINQNNTTAGISQQLTMPTAPQFHHIIAHLKNCSNVTNDTTLQAILEKILTTLYPSTTWNTNSLMSCETYTIALLENLYLAVYTNNSNSLCVDLYTHNNDSDPRSVIALLEKELVPASIDMVCADLSA